MSVSKLVMQTHIALTVHRGFLFTSLLSERTFTVWVRNLYICQHYLWKDNIFCINCKTKRCVNNKYIQICKWFRLWSVILVHIYIFYLYWVSKNLPQYLYSSADAVQICVKVWDTQYLTLLTDKSVCFYYE